MIYQGVYKYGRDFITLIIQGWLYEFQTIAMIIVIDK